MKTQILILLTISFTLSACAQPSPKDKAVGGSCEGCDAIYHSPIPFDRLNWVDTLPDFNEPGPKLIISGIIFKKDGKTPAPGIVLYVYHTDQTGHYTDKNKEGGSAGRNGYVKGWIKTNDKGQYKFYTLKPASYPQSNIPAHIHPLIKEPGLKEYWIDEFLFNDDPFLTSSERSKQQGRGGNGILKPEKRNGVLYAERNIYLGKDVPDYP